MTFYLFILFVAAVTLFLPIILRRISRRLGLKLNPAPYALLVIATVVYLVGPLLPDIHISASTDTFQEHFMGGVYTALLYVFFSRLFGWRPRWWLNLLGLFAWTSAFGVFNELFEFAIVQLNLIQIDITDTSWDLVANTVGSLTAFALLWLFYLRQRK
jgi:hypothetical protein